MPPPCDIDLDLDLDLDLDRERAPQVHLFGPGIGYLCRMGGRFTVQDPVYLDYLSRSEEERLKVTHLWYPIPSPGVALVAVDDEDERSTVDWGLYVLELAATDKLATFDASGLRPGDVVLGVYQERMAWSVYGFILGANGAPAALTRCFIDESTSECPHVPIFGAELLPRNAAGLLQFGDALRGALATCDDLVCPVMEVADDHPLLRSLALAPKPGATWYLSPGGHMLDPGKMGCSDQRGPTYLLLLIAHGGSAFERACACDLTGTPVAMPPVTDGEYQFVDSKFA